MNIRHLDWFYSETVNEGVMTLSDEEARHLKVKRHYSDEKIIVFDGKGTIGIGMIVDKNKVKVDVVQKIENDAFLTIASCVPKGDRFDFLLQKLTELNVSEIILMKTSHSVVLPKENKVERMKRIILEACKQSKRANLPKIRSLTDFNEIIKEKYENKIILDIEGKPLKDLVKNENQTSKKTIVLIGPEGGLTDEEIKSAEKAGFVKASVGKNVLRIETAAIAAAAIVGSSAY